MIFEDVDDSIDPSVLPLICRQYTKQNKETYVKMNDVMTEVNPLFKLYIFTTKSNPHFNPDIQSKTAMLNFSITIDGLSQ